MAGLTGGGGGGGAGDPILVTQEAVSFGESGVNLTRDGVNLDSGTLRLSETANEWYDPENNSSFSNVTMSGAEEFGWEITPNVDISRLRVRLHSTFDGTSMRLEDSNGNILETVDASGGYEVFTTSLTAGNAYEIIGTSERRYDDDGTGLPLSKTDAVVDVTGSASVNSNPGTFQEIEATQELVGSATVGFGSIPADLAAWDIATWQYERLDGSLSFDVEVDDGSGWSVFKADVLPPVDISAVDTASDVRVVARFSKPNEVGSEPVVRYVARRGER